MPDLKERLPEPSVGTGIKADLKRLNADGRASIAELREFARQLRGKSPQQVLQAISASSLFRSMCVATVGCVVLLVVLTVVPYAWQNRSSSTPQPAASAANPPTPAAAPSQANNTADSVQVKMAPAGGTGPGGVPDPNSAAGKKILETQGLGGTKTGGPDDKAFDKLLDGVK